MAKLLAKKPRPFKLIRGLAVVRPTKTEYLDNDPLGSSPTRRGKRALTETSSDAEIEEGDQKLELGCHLLNGDIYDEGEHAGAEDKEDHQRFHMKQLDMTKVQVGAAV